MRDKIFIVSIGAIAPHVKAFIAFAWWGATWWTDWVKPSLQSLVGAVIGLFVIHYGKQLLHSFDNWRSIRKLNKFRNNGRDK